MPTFKCNQARAWKSEQKIIENINTRIKELTKLSQWKNSTEVKTWFQKLKQKHTLYFLMFDVDNYYPSITEELLTAALEWAETMVEISEDEKKII